MGTRNQLTGFDLDRISSKLTAFRISVNDYKVVTPTLARVVLNMNGVPEDDLQVRASIANLFKNQASAVEGSFRWANRNGDVKSVVGYVKANNDVREFDPKADGNKYRAMASNLLMDQEDKTLWEIRSGSGDSKYLARQGNEDLSALVHLATNFRSVSPRLCQIASGAPVQKDFVAFVDRKTEEVRYGFAVTSATADTKGMLTVVATDDEEAVDVPEEDVLDVYELDAEDMAKVSTAAAPGLSKEAMIAYYKKAYSYSPEYIQLIINTINQHSFA